MEISCFTFNPFQENTYIVYDETLECVIFDPGCNSIQEERILSDYVRAKNLNPVRLINTHCHIDHILGNRYISEQYQLPLEIHKGELETLRSGKIVSQMYGISYDESPEPQGFLEDGEKIKFGKTVLETIYTPGHSPASLSFYWKEGKLLIAGDVLFRQSIGRTDLPGGDYATLISSILERLFPLGDDVVVFPGHGPKTTIGHERVNNPFLT